MQKRNGFMYTKFFKLTITAVYGVLIFVILGGSVSALTPPLDSGKCYTVNNGSFEVVTCPVPMAVSPPGCTLVQKNAEGVVISSGSVKIDCQTGRAENGLLTPPLPSGKCYLQPGAELVFETVTCPVPMAVSPPGCTLVQKNAEGVVISSGSVKIDCQTGSSPNELLTPPLPSGKCYVTSGVSMYKIVICPPPLIENPGHCVLLTQVNAEGEPISSGRKEIDCQTGAELDDPVNDPTNPPSSDNGNAILDGDCKSGLTRENCAIVGYLVNAINILSALAGMAIIGSIMMAGYQYMTARDNSGQIEAAKKRIIWALVALGLFIFMYSLLNWLVPGGVL